jgi:hypothetical protein
MTESNSSPLPVPFVETDNLEATILLIDDRENPDPPTAGSLVPRSWPPGAPSSGRGASLKLPEPPPDNPE